MTCVSPRRKPITRWPKNGATIRRQCQRRLLKEAKAGEIAAKADAKAQMKISDANKTANQKSSAHT